MVSKCSAKKRGYCKDWVHIAYCAGEVARRSPRASQLLEGTQDSSGNLSGSSRREQISVFSIGMVEIDKLS